MSRLLQLDAVQEAHANHIVGVTRAYVMVQLNKPLDYAERACDIALAVALVESELKVYANPKVPGSMERPHDAVGHDHRSVGIFQQQVPMWGTVADCQDVTGSTHNFLRRLFKLNWEGRTNGQLAQSVQGSAYPDRYAKRDLQAIRIRKALW